MQEIKVKDLKAAAKKSLDILELSSIHKANMSIALTGGNFGKEFSNQLAKSNFNNSKLSIFQTDERFVPYDNDDSIQKEINKIFQVNSLNDYSSFFFDTSVSFQHCFLKLKKELDALKLSSFDFTVLSIGEDGHLAGHFENSTSCHNNIFCFTSDSPKPPKERVSFNIQWLLKSDIVILAGVGNRKEKAVRRFKEGEGLHSSLRFHPNLYLLT